MLLKQSTVGVGVIKWDIVISSSFPDISRYTDGTIKQIFIHNKEPFEIVGGRLKLNDY